MQPAHDPRPARWQVRLLGAVEARSGAQWLTRFPSRAVAGLLARLAMAPGQAHPREVLVEALWPGVDPSTGRNRLRQALSTLKSLLEAPGSAEAVLVADRLHLRVVPGALRCDALDFEALARAKRFGEALALHGGEFMPGHYDDWAQAERLRLAHLHEQVLAAAAALGPRLQAGAARSTAPPAAPSPAPPETPAALPQPAAPPLPAYLTRLFGAEEPCAALQAAVSSHRLVSLLGPGGSGKTRLAVAVAQTLAAEPGWAGTAFVPLVSCEDASALPGAIAAALGLPATGGADTPMRLHAGLVARAQGGRWLLVLDNLEQLLPAAAPAVAALVAAVPALHVLVTSRRALGIDGEQRVAAQPLPLPAPEAPLAEAAANPAVALFVDRARAVRADFHLGPRQHAAVVALVRTLHGMPLAIELAAARVRSLAPAEMAALLAQADSGAHLALLARSGPRAGHDARHASMAQVVAWSWRLLDAPEQRLLRALAVFASDATAAALAAVLDETLAPTLAHIDNLAAHNLLQVHDDRGPHTRYSLAEPVREYAATQRAEGEAEQVAAGLSRWLQQQAQAARGLALHAFYRAERPQVQAALAAGARRDAAPGALRLLLSLRKAWETEPPTEGVLTALEAALQAVEGEVAQAVTGSGSGSTASPAPAADQAAEQAALCADAHELLAYLRFELGFGAAAHAHARAALAAAGSATPSRGRALLRCAWLQLAGERQALHEPAEAQRCAALLDEALALARGANDRELQARVLHQQAVLATHGQGQWVAGEALLAQSEALWLALGDRHQALARRANRAQCWARLGRLDEAQACYEACEAAARTEGDVVGQIGALISLGMLHHRRRRWREAAAVHRRCVALCWRHWNRHGLAYALWNLPLALAHLRQPEAAMQLMGFARHLWTSDFGALTADDEAELRRVRRLVRVQCGAARTQHLEAEGAALGIAAAAALALQAAALAEAPAAPRTRGPRAAS